MYHSQKSSSPETAIDSDDNTAIWLHRIQEIDVQAHLLGSKEKVSKLTQIAKDMASSIVPITIIEKVFRSALRSPMHPFRLCMEKYHKQFHLMLRKATAISHMISMRIEEAYTEFMTGLLEEGISAFLHKVKYGVLTVFCIIADYGCYLAILSMEVYLPNVCVCKIPVGTPIPTVDKPVPTSTPFSWFFSSVQKELLEACREYNRRMLPFIKRYRTAVSLQVQLAENRTEPMERKAEILYQHAMFLPAEELERCYMSIFGSADNVAKDMREKRGAFDFILAASTLMYTPQLTIQELNKVVDLYTSAAMNGVQMGIHVLAYIFQLTSGYTNPDNAAAMEKWTRIYLQTPVTSICPVEYYQARIPISEALFRDAISRLNLD